MSVGHKWIPSFDTCGKLTLTPLPVFFVFVISYLGSHSWISFKLPIVQFSWSPCDSEFPMTGSRCLYDHLLSERYKNRWIRWMHLAMWHSQANDDRSVKDFGQRVLNWFGLLQQTDLHEEPFVILTTVWWRLYCVFAILVISSCTLAGNHTSQGQ